MKLAELIREIKAKQGKAEMLLSALNDNVISIHKTGGETYESVLCQKPFTVGTALGQFRAVSEELENLRITLQNTNLTTEVKYRNEKMVLAKLIYRYASVQKELNAIKGMSVSGHGFRDAEHYFEKPQMDQKAKHEAVQQLTKELQEIDVLIQATNWKTEV